MNAVINFKDLIIITPVDLQFNDLFNLEEIQRLQDLFSDAMGVASLITYPDGTPITSPSNFCRLCSDIIRKTEKGRAFCYQSDAVIGCHNASGPTIKRCLSSGLWDAGASITVGGKHIANWLIGQVRNEVSDQQQIIQFADEIGANRADYIDALNEVPIMTVEQFGKIAKMLFAFVNELSEKAYNNFQFKMQFIEREKVVALLREKEEALSLVLNSIRKSEEKFHSLYMNMSEGAALHELLYNSQGAPEDYVIVETNPAFERQLGISRVDVIGKTSREAYGLAEPPYLDTYSCVALTGEPVIFETYFPPLKKYFAISVYSPFKGSFATVFEDISERKMAELALRESEQRYRLLIQTANEGILVAQGTHLMFVNQMFVELTGYTEAELLARPFIEFVHQDDRELVIGNQQKRLRGEEADSRYQIRILKNDKSADWFEMSGMKIEWEGQPATMNFVTDISERRRSEEEIRIQNEKLRKINAEKDKFFSIIAHDLRSPFSGFLGLTQIMAEDLPSLTMAEIQDIAVSMRNSATNLFRLLENLLQWARVQQGLIAFNPEVIPLLQNIDESIAMVLEPARQKKISINYNIPQDIIVFADRNILQTIIRNLVSNAVKFTPAGGIITLSAKVNRDNSVEVSVKDNGIGISSKMIDHLFRLDVQTNRKGTEGEPSTGLGLLLCKEFVEKHNGKIWVESEEGKGSVFYFTIPSNEEGLLSSTH